MVFARVDGTSGRVHAALIVTDIARLRVNAVVTTEWKIDSGDRKQKRK